MNDLHKILYDMLEDHGRRIEDRIVDKRIDDQRLELTLDYTDTNIADYVVLAQDNTIVLRYEDTDNELHQDALQTDRRLKTDTLTHRTENGYLTIGIDVQGGDHGKRTHRR